MTNDGLGRDEDHGAYLLDEAEVRREFRIGSSKVWIELIHLLAQRWEDAVVARHSVSRTVRTLSDLAKLRCRPDGYPLAAAAVLASLRYDVTRDGETPRKEVE